jgi:hypothetical protein
MKKTRTVYKIFITISEEKSQNLRYRHKRENNTKMGLKKYGRVRTGFDWLWLGSSSGI